MQFNWDRVVQSSVGFGFDILNSRASRFPRLTIWLGEIALQVDWFVWWFGLWIGPLRRAVRFLISRASKTKLAMMPLSKRLAVAGAGALLTGLMDAFQQICQQDEVAQKR